MKKLIFKKFGKDTLQFFLLVSISISLIVWVIQAVNFLDIVTEDGHGFKIYFLYTLLSLPKIFSKILPFIYFVSLFYIILKYENNNELIIFWTIGIKKIEFVNVLIKYTFFYLILQLLLTIYIVPYTLDKARSYIRASNIDLYSSIIQEKKFIDTVKNLTIFVENKKNNGELNNIFLKEKTGNNKYQIIFAKKGKIVNINDRNSFYLYDGRIIDKNNGKLNSFKFSETELNLSKFSTKTTTHPKIQETTTLNILRCIYELKDFSRSFIGPRQKSKRSILNCNMNDLKESFQEIIKRVILPLYLPVLSLIAALIIIKSKDDFRFTRYKFSLFILGVLVIIISEVSMRYSGEDILSNISLIVIPLLFFLLIYLFFTNKLRKPKIINQ